MLGLLLAATMGLLLMASLYDNFRDLIEVGASAGDMLLYYVTLMRATCRSCCRSRCCSRCSSC